MARPKASKQQSNRRRPGAAPTAPNKEVIINTQFYVITMWGNVVCFEVHNIFCINSQNNFVNKFLNNRNLLW